MEKENKIKCYNAAYCISFLANRVKNDYRDKGISFKDDCAIMDVEWMSENELHTLINALELYGLQWYKRSGGFVISLDFENVLFLFFRRMALLDLKVSNTLSLSANSLIYIDMNQSKYDDFLFHKEIPFPMTTSFGCGNIYLHF